MVKKIKLFMVMTALVLGVSIPVGMATNSVQVSAQGAASQIKKGMNQSGGEKNKTSLPKFLEMITNLMLFLVGAIAVIAIVISGIRFVTASGNQEQIKSARDGVLYSVVGIVVALMAYAIVRFIVNNIK